MSEERTFTLEEVRQLLARMGISQEAEQSAGNRIADAIQETITKPGEREIMMRYANQGAQEIAKMRKQKSQSALRQQYEEELAKIPRGQINSFVALKKKYRDLGLEVY